MTEPTPQPADEQAVHGWCVAAADGDAEAVERLLWNYHPRLLAFARRKIGVDWQGRIEPEDLLQEAYIDVFNQVSGFEHRGDDSFYHWVVRIVDHKFIDNVRALRRKKRDVAREVGQRPGSTRGRETLIDRCMAESKTPSHIMRREDAMAAISSAMARLPDEYRDLVRRHYLDEVPLADLAAEAGKSEDAIRRQIGRAVDKLAAALGRASRFLSKPP